MYATVIFGLFISVVGKKKRQTNSATSEGVILRVPFPKKIPHSEQFERQVNSGTLSKHRPLCVISFPCLNFE